MLSGGPALQFAQTRTSESCFVDGLCRITPDGEYVAFVTEVMQAVDTTRAELLRTSIGAGALQRLDAQTSPDSDVFAFVMSPDGRQMIYVADQDVHDMVELFLVEAETQIFLPLLFE